MSLQSRLADLITAVGADVKAIRAADLKRATGYMPPSGVWLQPANCLSFAAGSPLSGQVTYWPLDIGPAGLAIQSIGCNCTTARVGGTSVVEKIGLYLDNGSGGLPLLTSAGLIISGSIDLSTTGKKTVASSLTLDPGRYWGAFIYSATAPSTAPQTTCSTNATTLHNVDSVFPQISRYLRNTAKTDLPVVTTSVPTGVSDSNGTIVGIRAA